MLARICYFKFSLHLKITRNAENCEHENSPLGRAGVKESTVTIESAGYTGSAIYSKTSYSTLIAACKISIPMRVQ